MSDFVLAAPLSGWAVPLDEVPDEVFAGRMMGDGIAIDPIGGSLRAPCDGIVIAAAPHAVNVRAACGAEILMHLGLESVALKGKGFRCRVREGDAVKTGDELIAFDLEFLAGNVKSLLSPVVVTNSDRFPVAGGKTGARVAVGAPLMKIASAGAAGADPGTSVNPSIRRDVVCLLENGLHARPAARIARVVRSSGVRIRLSAHGRAADGASVAELMALGLGSNDPVVISAEGEAALAAMDAVAECLAHEPSHGSDRAAAAAPQVSQADAGPDVVCGVCAAPGRVAGTPVWVKFAEFDVPEVGRGVAVEAAALEAALEAARRRLAPDAGGTGEQADILAAHLALLDDPKLMQSAQSRIAEGKSAGFAWRAAIHEATAALAGLDNARLRARMDDFADLEQQVLSGLDIAAPTGSAALPDDAIVVAETLYPSQLAALDPAKVTGIVTSGGSPTSHVALIAAAMGVPMLAAVGTALSRIPRTGTVLLDAGAGRLLLSPSSQQLAAARADAARRTEAAVAARANAAQDCRSADGMRIEVFANLGGKPGEADQAVRLGAEGCGLLRSEFLFLERKTPPDEDEQLARYQEAADAFAGASPSPRPVILRTFDIGADKPAPYLPQPAEDNPALGVRGIRLALANPGLLRTQLRAALRVKPAGRCRLMLPMVSDVSELVAVREMLATLADELSVPAVSLGIMIETPAAALIAGRLAEHADFFSVGTNDLTQYALAMDRTNPTLAGRADGLHPAVLKLIAAAVGGSAGKPVGVCGALAADPLAVPVLIGLGVREVSMPAPAVAGIKDLIRRLRISDCENLAAAALSCADAAVVRALVRARLTPIEGHQK